MNVLFITSNRLGDAVLSTGLLDHILRSHDNAAVTVACGGLPASLFEGMPGMRRTVVIKKKKYHGHWFDLWRRALDTRWDMIVDLRNSAVSRALPADQKFIYGRGIDKKLHKVEQCAAVMKLSDVPAPVIWMTEAQEEKAESLIPDNDEPVLGVGPTANWIGKTWAPENFAELVRRLTASDGILPGARIAVFAAPGEEENAYKVLQTVPQSRQLDLIAKTDPGTAAAALSRCALYVGNDSGLMHCAAAAGTPTFGLFGPSWPHLYRPWGAHTAFVSTPQDFAALTNFSGYDPKTLDRSLMTGLTVDMVKQGVKDFWARQSAAAA